MYLPHEHWALPEYVEWALLVLERLDGLVERDHLLVVSVSEYTEKEKGDSWQGHKD